MTEHSNEPTLPDADSLASNEPDMREEYRAQDTWPAPPPDSDARETLLELPSPELDSEGNPKPPPFPDWTDFDQDEIPTIPEHILPRPLPPMHLPTDPDALHDTDPDDLAVLVDEPRRVECQRLSDAVRGIDRNSNPGKMPL